MGNLCYFKATESIVNTTMEKQREPEHSRVPAATATSEEETVDDISRDLAEFRGALLAAAVAIPDDENTSHLPMAQAVPATESGAVVPSQNPSYASVARAPPASSVHQLDESSDDDAVAKKLAANETKNSDDNHVTEAVALPGAYTTPNTEEQDRYAARVGTMRGRLQANQEVQDILNHNRTIPVRNFAEQQQIREIANPNALVQNYKEEVGLTQTSATVPKESYVPKPARKEPEFYAGTYGQDYQIGEYQTKDYETTEYETTEYKSVYES